MVSPDQWICIAPVVIYSCCDLFTCPIHIGWIKNVFIPLSVSPFVWICVRLAYLPRLRVRISIFANKSGLHSTNELTICVARTKPKSIIIIIMWIHRKPKPLGQHHQRAGGRVGVDCMVDPVIISSEIWFWFGDLSVRCPNKTTQNCKVRLIVFVLLISVRSKWFIYCVLRPAPQMLFVSVKCERPNRLIALSLSTPS